MATGVPIGSPQVLPDEARAARQTWGWVLTLGAVQVVLGTLAVVMSFVATFATVVTIGVFALIGAGAQLASVFSSRRWEGVLTHLLVALLYAAFGLMAILRPELTAATLTLILAVMLIVGGVFRIVMAASARFHDWGWAALGGALSVLLGALIWQGWPGTGLWVIGLFVGIDLILIGWTWVAVGLTLRRLSREPAPAV
jgi:uncharacterized membrane protein HdeD (DUF308 family)